MQSQSFTLSFNEFGVARKTNKTVPKVPVSESTWEQRIGNSLQFFICAISYNKQSCVAVWKNGRVEICPNEQGNRITPSYVAWTAMDSQRLIGDAAKNQLASNPSNTVFDVKRLIGRKFSDPILQKDLSFFPYKSGLQIFRSI